MEVWLKKYWTCIHVGNRTNESMRASIFVGIPIQKFGARFLTGVAGKNSRLSLHQVIQISSCHSAVLLASNWATKEFQRKSSYVWLFWQSKQINQHNPSRILQKVHREIKNPQEDTKNFSNKTYLEGPTKKNSTKLGEPLLDGENWRCLSPWGRFSGRNFAGRRKKSWILWTNRRIP